MRSSLCPAALKSRKEVSEATYLRIHLWTDRISVRHLAMEEWKEWQVLIPSGKFRTIDSY